MAKEQYEKMYHILVDYEMKIHEKNQSRIKYGIRCLILIPLIFMNMLFWLGGSKVVYMTLWIISIFLISGYLILIEYMDTKLQTLLNEVNGVDDEGEIEALIGTEFDAFEAKAKQRMDEVKDAHEERKQETHAAIQANRDKRKQKRKKRKGKKGTEEFFEQEIFDEDDILEDEDEILEDEDDILEDEDEILEEEDDEEGLDEEGLEEEEELEDEAVDEVEEEVDLSPEVDEWVREARKNAAKESRKAARRKKRSLDNRINAIEDKKREIEEKKKEIDVKKKEIASKMKGGKH